MKTEKGRKIVTLRKMLSVFLKKWEYAVYFSGDKAAT
jgi:hypothetical protein